MIGAIRSVIFWSDGTNSIKKYLIKDGKLQVKPKNILRKEEKSWTPKVTPQSIIPPKRSFTNLVKPIGFKQGDLILAVEGSPECIAIRGIDSKELDEIKAKELGKQTASKLMKVWTMDEVRSHIRKAIARGSVSRKMFNDNQWFMFMMVLFLNTGLLVIIMRYIGVF